MLLAGLYLVFAIPLQTPSFITRQSLEIVATGDRNPQAKGNEVRLVGLYQPDGTPINFSKFSTVGNWEVVDDQLVAHQQFPSTLSWYGNGLGDYKLVFIAHPWSGVVKVIWNGNEQTIDLYVNPGGSQEIRLSPIDKTPPLFKGVYMILAGSSIGLILFMLSGYLVTRRLVEQRSQKPVSRWAILWYALPMVLVWTIYLLAFWPGLMSPDSIYQWAQILTGRFNDYHPAFHTMIMWLITRIWLSPAAVAWVQIIVLSILVGWGLTILYKMGVPGWLPWIISIIFAISPIDSTMTITLWKDIPYSTSIFCLTLMLFKIITEDGEWLSKPISWLSMGITMAMVALYRHSGWPIVLVTTAVIFFVFRRYQRYIVYASLVFIGLLAGIRGPVYRFTNVNVQATALYEFLPIHHIAAHIAYGTPLTKDEKLFLSSIRPLNDKWSYYCYNVDSTIFNNQFKWDVLEQQPSKINRIFISLLQRDPKVDLKHLVCSSSLVWRITQPKDGYLATYPIWTPNKGEISYIAENKLGLREKSLLPSLENYLFRFLQFSESTIIWRPAIYLYFAILSTSLLAIRTRSWKYMVILAPIVAHSSIILLVGYAQDFRFQYPVFLVSIFSISFLFVTRSSKRELIHNS